MTRLGVAISAIAGGKLFTGWITPLLMVGPRVVVGRLNQARISRMKDQRRRWLQ